MNAEVIPRELVQINLQPKFGGGEVYTRFLCQALAELGWRTRLLVSARATFWQDLKMPATRLQVADDLLPIMETLPAGTVVIGHGPLPKELVRHLADRLILCAIAHMPLYGRNPRAYDGHRHVFAVSAYVAQTLREAGVAGAYPEPLYGVADLSRVDNSSAVPLRRHSCFDWDRRKGRDRLLSWFEPAWEAVRPIRYFSRRPGLTLGLVSRLTPIKQFPLLFQHLAPILARYPNVSLEIFGSGGYASVRDLRVALAPARQQVRFWGQQRDVGAAYRKLDYLLTGLPEREALGLNVLESQAAGTPVIAVAAPPFVETVVDGVSGWLYTDPRQDNGADFERVLQRCLALAAPLDPARSSHLELFSQSAFVERLGRALEVVTHGREGY